jgi:hypothetical protein
MAVGDGEEHGMAQADRSAMRPPKPRNIHFLLPVVQPGDVDKLNKQVRSLTMMRVRREKRSISQRGSQPPRRGFEREADPSTEQAEARWDGGLEALRPGGGPGSIDPFRSTTLQLSARQSRLLHHCGFVSVSFCWAKMLKRACQMSRSCRRRMAGTAA